MEPVYPAQNIFVAALTIGPPLFTLVNMNPTTYQDLLEIIADESERLSVHRLEALAESAFSELVENEPEPSYPYGRGFTGPVVLS